MMIIDDFSDPSLKSKIGTTWRMVSDTVMGGVSQGRLTHQAIAGRKCIRLMGDVRLENNGGFIQASLDLSRGNGLLNASKFQGIQLAAQGNGERYSIHLRTPDAIKPWQSYRAEFVTERHWRSIELPFSDFKPHRLNEPLDTSRLKRLGLVAIGRRFDADVAIAELELYT